MSIIKLNKIKWLPDNFEAPVRQFEEIVAQIVQ